MTIPVVLVTGALTGIGRATAIAFAQDGARIVISGRRDEEGKSLVAERVCADAATMSLIETPAATVNMCCSTTFHTPCVQKSY